MGYGDNPADLGCIHADIVANASEIAAWGETMSHQFELRVYYEDTDLAGIVYYANYLKFIERARSEWVRGLGLDQGALKAEEGLVFAVRRVVADYVRPAVFDDLLQVRTTLLEAEVTLVCVTLAGRPARLPQALRVQIAAG